MLKAEKIILRILLIIALSPFSLLNVLSQSYITRTYTTENGLPHNNVRNMVTDSSGFLWIATWDGLSRFDGYEFRNYHHIPGDSTSIPYFSVKRVVVDKTDNLWILTDAGLAAMYDRENDNFIRLTEADGEIIPSFVSVSTDNEGAVWFISLKKIVCYNPANRRLRSYRINFSGADTSLNAGLTYSLTRQDEKTLWLAGLTTYKLEPDTSARLLKVIKKYESEAELLPEIRQMKNYDHSPNIFLYISPSGKKWLLCDDGLRYIDEEKKLIKRHVGEIPQGEFTGREYFIWGGTEGGMHIYRTEDSKLIQIPANRCGLLKNAHPGGKDIIWYSSTSTTGNPEGLTRLILTPDYFKKYSPATDDDRMPAVFSITMDNDKNVWLGLRGRDHIPVFTPDGKIIRKYTPASPENGYYGPVRKMISTPEGIWIGYFYRLLLFYNYRTGSFTTHDPGSEFYRALAIDKKGILYSGSEGRIRTYNPGSRTVIKVSDPLPVNQIFKLVVPEDNIIWAAQAYSKAVKYDPESGDQRVYTISENSYNIEDILITGKEEIWLALLGGGIAKLNSETGKSTFYTTRSGLANNTVYCLLRDKSGNIWASTDNGISRLNPATGIIKNFGLPEGLDIVEFNSGASYVDDAGWFYFGGMGGAVKFHPDSINIQESTATRQRIILTGLTVSGKPKHIGGSVNKVDIVVLSPGENNFQLTFSASDFASSDRTLYRYRLTEKDKEWIVLPHTNRSINYAGLDPGWYNLVIEATDRNGEWTARRELAIRLMPLFRQTLFFRIAAGLLIITVISSMIMIYIRQLRQEAKQVRDQLRLQALQGQMNPHFIFNSLNSINYFISKNDTLSANRYISDFAGLIRNILSNMGRDYISFSEEKNSLSGYLEIEHLRFGDKFDYVLDVSGIDNGDELYIIPGMVQPFVENAIWHGVRALEKRKGRISIKFTSSGSSDRLRCIIEDDGIGRKAAAEMRGSGTGHNSKGIAIVMERLAIIGKLRGTNYEIRISDVNPGAKETGTRVEIDIPAKTT